jgi:hypothetical protein
MRTEDDIRAAFRDLASRAPDTAEVLAPIPARGASVAGSASGRRQGWRRLAAALAAGTAVAGVIAASVAVTSRGHPSEPGSRPNHLLASVPRYYMAVEAAYPGSLSYAGSHIPPQYAVIRNTVTGATLATIRPPKPFRTFEWVAGGADDRTFVLAAVARRTQSVEAGYPAKLFRARFDPATGKVRLTALPIPEIPAGNENYAANSFRTTTIAGLALTRSETTLAVGLEVMTKHGIQTQIRVYSLDSGAVKIWRASTGNLGFGDQPRLELSWGPGGILAFNWSGLITCNQERCRESADSGIRLLNTRAGGTSLIGDSRLVVHGSSGKFVANDGVLTADGQKIVTCWEVDPGPFRPHEITFEFGEYSAATGRQIGILWRAATGESLEWANSSGSVLVVQAPIISGRNSGDRDVRDVFGVLSGHRFVPIPGAPAPYLYYSDLTVLAF